MIYVSFSRRPPEALLPLQAKRAGLGKDVDINKYVAGGIAVFDLGTRLLKWHTHLDLSTDETSYRAHIYSAPTVADVDGDGGMEIIVGTSMVRCLLRLGASSQAARIYSTVWQLEWTALSAS